jgi:hypothetical protein
LLAREGPGRPLPKGSDTLACESDKAALGQALGAINNFLYTGSSLLYFASPPAICKIPPHSDCRADSAQNMLNCSAAENPAAGLVFKFRPHLFPDAFHGPGCTVASPAFAFPVSANVPAEAAGWEHCIATL